MMTDGVALGSGLVIPDDTAEGSQHPVWREADGGIKLLKDHARGKAKGKAGAN